MHNRSTSGAGYCVGIDESVSSAVLRIADGQALAAIQAAGDLLRPTGVRVHEARKHAKKLRALLRLACSRDDAFFGSENAAMRDAARELSAVRDREVVLAVCAGLSTTCAQSGARTQFARLRRKLDFLGHAENLDPIVVGHALRRFIKRMRHVRIHIHSWPVATVTRMHLEHGFLDTYRRSRRALRRVQLEPSDENFHTLRKRVKEHGCHLRLLRRTWSESIGVRLAQVERLAELLGRERDLAMLSDRLLSVAGDSGVSREATAMFAAVDQQRVKLRAKAVLLAEVHLAPGPAELLANLRGWRVAA